MTFPGGTHDLWIRYWLAAGGIDPDKDIETIVVPPPQMVANMKVGTMDCFCVCEPWNLQLILEKVKVPVLVDAGVGTASDAAIAMELGCDGVLMNTAIAKAREPVRMAHAMKLAVEAGREAWLAGRMAKKPYEASPSSPTSGLIQKSA